MTIDNAAQFLVNRNDTASTVTAENLMSTILDTDLMIVNRNDQVQTVTGLDVKEFVGDTKNSESFLIVRVQFITSRFILKFV